MGRSVVGGVDALITNKNHVTNTYRNRLYSGVLVVATVFVYFCIPETKGRTYTEIDALWAQGVPPRKFASTNLVPVAVEKTEDL